MRNQAVFAAGRLIAVSKTLVEIEDYLGALANEVAVNQVAVEEKAIALDAISRAKASITQLRDALKGTKKPDVA